MEACESYVKQSWRNRCRILTANGPLDFAVPIIHAASQGNPSSNVSLPLDPTSFPPLINGAPENSPIFGEVTRVAGFSEGDPLPAAKLITAVKVEYDTPWVAKFKRAVESAYGNSPYYIYYEDEFWRIFGEKPETLWELNWRIIEFICAKIGIAPEILPTKEFGGEGECRDLRETIHPKRKNEVMKEMGVGRPYWQVFREKFGFVAGLSVLDLLFNEGPESLAYLR